MSGAADPAGGGPTGDGFEDRDILAAEYVIGTLEPQEARAIEALSFHDPSVAAGIAAWEARLGPLAETLAPIPPPAMLWQRLALATGIESVIQAPPAPRRTAAGRAWRSPGLWRALTAGAVAVAASMAFLLFNAPLPTTPAGGAAPLIAALTPYGGPGATFLIRVGQDGQATVVAVGDTAVPPGRSLELWAVKAGATAPVSMGLLPGSGRARLPIALPPDTQLLVSQEPAGGSPTKLPTGPVVYAGKLTGI